MKYNAAALSIAGSDPVAGAGIQADLKTFASFGVYGMTVITSVVAENTAGVSLVYDLPIGIIKEQIRAVFDDISVNTVKVGMLKNIEIMNGVFSVLGEYSPENIVLDTVMSATAGGAFMEDSAVRYLKESVIPSCSLVTPNIPEAERILGKKISSAEEMESAAFEICALGANASLVKGGHLAGEAVDVLCCDGRSYIFESKRVNKADVHGTGCTLSSAVAACLANGQDIAEAVRNAKEYIGGAIENSISIGKGSDLINHFYKFDSTENGG